MKYILHDNFWEGYEKIKSVDLLPPDHEWNIWRLEISADGKEYAYNLNNFHKELVDVLRRKISHFLINDNTVLNLDEVC